MTYDWKRGMTKKALRAMQAERDGLVATVDRLLEKKDAEIERLTADNRRYRDALTTISGSADRLQASQAICALDNIGPDVRS